ncbi:NUDIX domain-containing protein [Streptomyces cinereoruber]
MTATPASDEALRASIADEDYGALRAAAAVWAGASVLITDRHGRVLIEHAGYRDTCLLPGGAVDKGESPAHAAARELREELGITMSLDRGLAVDWVSAAGVEARPALRFPARSCTSSTAARGATSRSPPSGPAQARSRRSSSSSPPDCPS